MKKTRWRWGVGALLRCAAGLSGGFCLWVVGLHGVPAGNDPVVGLDATTVRAPGGSGAATPPAVWGWVPDVAGQDLKELVAAPGDLNGDGFDDLAIGEPGYEGGVGRVVVYLGGATGLGRHPAWQFRPGPYMREFGRMVSALGDVDKDGFADLMVTAMDTGSPPDLRVQGRCWIYHGSAGGLVRPTRWSGLGYVLFHGDFNADGWVDLAGHRDNPDRSSPLPACVGVFYGGKTGFAEVPDWLVCGEQQGAEFGHDVALAGDVNGDGADDLLVGAMKHTGRFSHGGKVYLYAGGVGGVGSTPAWTSEYPVAVDGEDNEQKELFFGWGLGGAGDVNGDRFADVMVGACYADREDRNEGLAFLFLGSKEGVAGQPAWFMEGNQPHSLFGQAVCGVGDVNGDGYDDVAVGVPQAANGQLNEGVILVFPGSAGGLVRQPLWVVESDLSHAQLGAAIRAAGDVNGDGRADFLGFAPGYQRAAPDGSWLTVGRVQLFEGRVGALGIGPGRWSAEKPWLVAVQGWFRRRETQYGSVIYWGPAGFVVGGVMVGFLVVQTRLRRRIQELLAENAALVQSRERTRIARDMHDHLGADLTQILLQAKLMMERLRGLGDSPGPATEVIASAERAVGAMDELVWATDPLHDSVESFLAYLGDFAVSYLGAHRMRCRCEFPEGTGGVGLAGPRRRQLFLAAKEAIHNAAKHSGGTVVCVRVNCSAGWLRLRVEDDGRGFEKGHVRSPGVGAGASGDGVSGGLPPRRGGHGLANLQTRLKELGGEAVIQTVPGRGTVVELRMPLGSGGEA